MGFHEKSAWGCLLGIALVFIPYFVVVFKHPLAFVGLFFVAIVVQVVFMTAFHIVIAVFSKSIRKSDDAPPTDELDRTIELRAAKASGIVLGVVVICWCLSAMYGTPALGVYLLAQAEANNGAPLSTAQFTIPVVNVLTAVHLLFAGFVLANFVYYGSIIVSYRRLTHG